MPTHVTTTASCEAFCEACLFLSIYFRQCKGLFSGRGARWEPKWPIFDPLPENGEMTKKFPCFSSRLLLPIFQPSRPLSGNALKKKKAFRSPPACVPPCRQMMRTRSGASGRSGGQLPKHAGLPVSGSFQLRTKPLRMSSSSRAASNSLKPEHSSPRRHSARTSGRCPCAARWDAVVTASYEAFCELFEIFGPS